MCWMWLRGVVLLPLCRTLCFCALCCSQLSMNGFQGNHREQCGVCVCLCVTLQAKIPISSVRVVQCFPHTGFTSAGWPVPNGCTDIVVFFHCDWLQNKSQENVCVDAYVCECKNWRTRRRRGLKPRPRLHLLLIFDDSEPQWSECDLSTDVNQSTSSVRSCSMQLMWHAYIPTYRRSIFDRSRVLRWLSLAGTWVCGSGLPPSVYLPHCEMQKRVESSRLHSSRNGV